jgi:SAM-dependent methyltransferase
MMEDIPGAHVCGLDISEAMIEKARRNYGHMDGLELMVGDAARLNEYFQSPFDAIVYSASIFLIPDYGLSLKQARELLTPGGSVGLTFMDGLYDDQGGNLIAKVETEHSIGISLKRAVKLDDFREGFRETFNSVDSWTRDYNLPSERLREFFSVPAMSAGLFPSLPYEKRLEKLDELFSHLPANGVGFRWIFMTGGA